MQIAALLLCGTAFADTHTKPALLCEPTLERHAITLGVQPEHDNNNWLTRLIQSHRPSLPLEVYGSHAYQQTLPNGWTFALQPQPHGWSIRLYDAQGKVDLSSITPPFASVVPNPRDISGWHFRNSDNTGPNTASNSKNVNAPQHLRLFEFSSALIGTGGFKPPQRSAQSGEGRGWLQIIDYGLADLQPDTRARMVYLKARGCLTWPRSETERMDFQARNMLGYTDEERETLAACGLDTTAYALSALVAPRHLSADLDGDDTLDHLAQVINRDTGERDIALCLAGTHLTLLNQSTTDPAAMRTVSAVERWQFAPRDFSAPGTGAGGAEWPDADGTVLVIERLEKSMFLVYFEQGTIRFRQAYGHPP